MKDCETDRGKVNPLNQSSEHEIQSRKPQDDVLLEEVVICSILSYELSMS